MIISDGTIYHMLEDDYLKIVPVSEEQIQPASIDLTLGDTLKSLNGDTYNISDEPYELKPKEFILASTYEYVEIPDNLVGQVEGRSSIGRLGVLIHITAGYIDPAFCGNITLELYNVSDKPFKLKYGDSICQLVLHLLDKPAIRPYGSDGLNSKYQYSDGVVESKYNGE